MILKKWPIKRRKNVIGGKKRWKNVVFHNRRKKRESRFKNAMSGNTAYDARRGYMCREREGRVAPWQRM